MLTSTEDRFDAVPGRVHLDYKQILVSLLSHATKKGVEV